MDFLKKGLSGSTLKLLALFFMTLDHIAYFVLPFNGVSLVFHWIGRLAAPLFIFMVAEGFYHTHSRKKYMFRLYSWSILMHLGNSLLNSILPHPEGQIIFNNIFTTMFLICIYCLGIDWLVKGFKTHSFKFGFLGILVMILPFISTGMIFYLINTPVNVSLLNVLMILIPSPFLVEGGIIFIGLGVGFYLLRSSKKAIALFYTLFCILYFFMTVNAASLNVENLLVINYQWLMFFALPFLYLYNGEKGKSMKYFFYIYYPLHSYVLYAIGVYLTTLKLK